MSRKYSHQENPLSFEWVLEKLKSGLTSSLEFTPFTVAFSGGLDSTVLLHLMVILRNQGYIKTLTAIHIHHGLSDFADQWAEHCDVICQQWGIPLMLSKVTLRNKGQGVEQAARDVRYQVFTELVGKDGVLLQGHHRDDLAETILLRLFRGTGVDGIQGIPEQRSLGDGSLFRPLLSVPKKSVEHYASQHELEYIHDDSNIDERFSRNFLRQTLIPQIEERWPGASDRITEFALEADQLKRSQQPIISEHLSFCTEYRPEWLLANQPLLNLECLSTLHIVEQGKVIRAWLKEQHSLLPSRRTLERIFQEVIEAREDGEPQLKVTGNITICRFQYRLILRHDDNQLLPFEPFYWDWQLSPTIMLGSRVLGYVMTKGTRLMVELPKRPLRVCRRSHLSDSMKIAIAGRSGRKTLKRWL
ncbi:MAG: tRNA lysidine(34) synthetase TilS, partial [Endozoicomonas sp.]